MACRVLHIFAPNFRQRFGGPIYNWQFYFSNWESPAIRHLVMDVLNDQVLPAQTAFSFPAKRTRTGLSRWERFKWIFSLQAKLIKYHEEYDIIHFHEIWWGSLLSAVWAKHQGIPTLYESVLLDSDTPGAIRREGFGAVKLWLLKQFTGILAISDGIAEDYLQHGFRPDQVHMQMNCLDTTLFRPAESREEKLHCRHRFILPENAKVCLFVGSLIRRKGVDLLVDAFIKAQMQDPKLVLWLVGPKNILENPTLDESFVAEMMDRISEKRLDDCVRFEGILNDRAVLADAYRAADLFTFPSRQEGLPNVVLEAMASGLPVIVSALPGLKNVIQSDLNGVMINIDQAGSLEQAIIDLCRLPAKAERLTENARQYILESHSFTAWENQITDYYNLLAESKSK